MGSRIGMQFPLARKRRACLHILSSRRPIKVESSPAKFLGHLIFEFAIRPQRLAYAPCVSLRRHGRLVLYSTTTIRADSKKGTHDESQSETEPDSSPPP